MKIWHYTFYLLLALLIFSGCKGKKSSLEELTSPASVKQERKLSDESEDRLQMPDTVKELRRGFNVGDTVPDFKLKDPNGNEFALYQLLEDKPVMLEFGAYT